MFLLGDFRVSVSDKEGALHEDTDLFLIRTYKIMGV